MAPFALPRFVEAKGVRGQACELRIMALALRLWRSLPLGRSAAPGPRFPTGAAGSREQCVLWRLRGAEVPSPSWLPLSSPTGWAPAAPSFFRLGGPVSP